MLYGIDVGPFHTSDPLLPNHLNTSCVTSIAIVHWIELIAYKTSKNLVPRNYTCQSAIQCYIQVRTLYFISRATLSVYGDTTFVWFQTEFWLFPNNDVHQQFLLTLPCLTVKGRRTTGLHTHKPYYQLMVVYFGRHISISLLQKWCVVLFHQKFLL